MNLSHIGIYLTETHLGKSHRLTLSLSLFVPRSFLFFTTLVSHPAFFLFIPQCYAYIIFLNEVK